MSQDLLNRINDYLVKGGLFNPEYMEHEKVQQLLLDIRDYLQQPPTTMNKPITTWDRWYDRCQTCGITGVNGYVCSRTDCPYGITSVSQS